MQIFYTQYLDRLERLHEEALQALEGLPQAALDWAPGPEMNSLCVLLVHIAGAERYWIGDVVGEDPSERDRDREFEAKGLSRDLLKEQLSVSLTYTHKLLDRMGLEDLVSTRISPRDGREYSVAWSLLHALEHTALHVGHAQIVRQLWDQRW